MYSLAALYCQQISAITNNMSQPQEGNTTNIFQKNSIISIFISENYCNIAIVIQEKFILIIEVCYYLKN